MKSDFRKLFGEDDVAATSAAAAGEAGCPRLPGGTAPWCACKQGATDSLSLCWDKGKYGSPLRGWVFGRPTTSRGASAFFLGPLVATDTETATALVTLSLSVSLSGLWDSAPFLTR